MNEPARVGFAVVPAAPTDGGSTTARPTAELERATRPAARPRAAARRSGPSFAARLAQLLRLGRIQIGQLNAEDLRVLACLAVALVIACGAQIYPDTATVNAPVALPEAISGSAPSAAPAVGGRVDDPTSAGTITATTAHGLGEIKREFGAVLRGASCWDEHAWNPSSDHPRGRACDVYTSPAGKFAEGAGLDAGNRLVAWLRAHHEALRVSYVIWQGRIWSPERGDRSYSGGGVYDAKSAVGGHFDHIHVSFRD